MPHVLLSRAPLCPKTPSDLHALGTPPAFVLSQDQTRRQSEVNTSSGRYFWVAPPRDLCLVSNGDGTGSLRLDAWTMRRIRAAPISW